jgi:Tol biopolymer transport system component
MHGRMRWGAAAAALSLSASGCHWITRASVDGTGGEANSASDMPSSSADGRYVAFESFASNLVDGDTNAVRDIFVRDIATGAVERVSVRSDSSEANAHSSQPVMSDDGRYVAFASVATNLVDDDTDGGQDVFLHDRQTGVTIRVSDNAVAPAHSPDTSAAGRYVVFEAGVLNPRLLQFPSVYRYDHETASTEHVFGGFTGGTNNGGLTPSVSDDGRFVAFTSVRAGGGPTGFVVPDVFVRDMLGATTLLAIDGDVPSISGNGRFVAYHIAPPGGISQVFVTDRITGVTRQVSVNSSGTAGEASSVAPSITDDGRYVAYTSGAANLVARDTNGADDVFVHDRLTVRTVLVSDSVRGTIGNGASVSADIAGQGRYVAFASTASNLVADDANGASDVFVRAFPQPAVLSAVPSKVARGTTAQVTITGRDFQAPLTVTVAGGGVAVGAVSAISETEVVATLTVDATAPVGARLVTVTNAGTGAGPNTGASGTCQCMTISAF